jgi:Predicted membrane protein (DUF2232)
MPVSFLIGLGGGLASALLFYSAARGSPLFGTLLLVLTPLPSLLTGLGWGWLPAAAGAVAGALVMAFAASTSFAAGYFLALGLPAVLFAYLALLSRPHPEDPDKREWYPAGRLVAALSLYGGALPVLVLPLIGGSYETLQPAMGEFFRRFSAHAPELGMRQLTDQQVEGLAEFVVAALPAALAAYWVAIFSLNLYLSGRIARASGRLGRDWPDLPAMTYPAGFPLLVALAIAASFVSGTVGVAGTSLSGALFFAYLLAGLALMHLIARGRGGWILWIVYAGLIVFGPYMALALTFAGLLDPVLKLGRRLGAPPPAT